MSNRQAEKLPQPAGIDHAPRAEILPGERRIRSYVSRTAKMGPRRQQAYNRWKPIYCLPFREEFIELREIFPRGDIFLEIGFGMGEAAAAMAERHPHWNYLGVEVYKPGVGKLLSEMESRKLSNIRIINFDVVRVLEVMIPDDVFSGVHIFFPDPWPKKRHNKRRLIQSGFLNLLLPKVKIGGYLYCTTDWDEYGEQMLDVLSRFDELENPSGGWARSPVWRPETQFERKGLKKNHGIRELYFVKKPYKGFF